MDLTTTETTASSDVVPTFGYNETFSVLTDRLKTLLTEMKSMKKELDTLKRTTARTLKKSHSSTKTRSRSKKTKTMTSVPSETTTTSTMSSSDTPTTTTTMSSSESMSTTEMPTQEMASTKKKTKKKVRKVKKVKKVRKKKV